MCICYFPESRKTYGILQSKYGLQKIAETRHDLVASNEEVFRPIGP